MLNTSTSTRNWGWRNTKHLGRKLVLYLEFETCLVCFFVLFCFCRSVADYNVANSEYARFSNVLQCFEADGIVGTTKSRDSIQVDGPSCVAVVEVVVSMKRWVLPWG